MCSRRGPLERVLTAELYVAVRAEYQQSRVSELASEKLEQQQGRLVRPVEIVEHEDQWLAP